jgi:hypothetical protein
MPNARIFGDRMGFINGHDKSGHLHQKPGQMMLDSGGQDLPE